MIRGAGHSLTGPFFYGQPAPLMINRIIVSDLKGAEIF